MKTLVWDAFKQIPLSPACLPASRRPLLLWLCCVAGLKMRCNKLESIQSCEFWQELNKTERDRCDEGVEDDASLLHPVAPPSPAAGHAACQLFVTQRWHAERCNHRDTVSLRDISLHCLLLFQSSVGVCTWIRCMEMSLHKHQIMLSVWTVKATYKKCTNTIVQTDRKNKAHTRMEEDELWNRSRLLFLASARNKRRKLIFAKFSAVKDDSHRLAALRRKKWKSGKNSSTQTILPNLTDEDRPSSPVDLTPISAKRVHLFVRRVSAGLAAVYKTSYPLSSTFALGAAPVRNCPHSPLDGCI